MVRKGLGFSLCMVVLFVGGPLFAQSARPDVKAIVDQATKDARFRRYGDAVKGFKKAYEMTKDPAYLYNISVLLLMRMNEPLQAWQYSMKYREEARTEDEKREAEWLITQCELVLARTYGKVEVAVMPTTAEVWLDAVSDENRITRSVVWATPGTHTVIARAPGYEEGRTEVVVRQGVSTEVSLRLTPAKATLKVASKTPACKVKVDDKEYGFAPVEVQIEPGSHVVRAEASGYEPFEEKVVLEPGGTLVVQADLSPVAQEVVTEQRAAQVEERGVAGSRGLTRKQWAIVAFGAGGALVVGGSVLYGIAYQQMKDAENENSQERYDSKVESARRKGYAAYALWGVGGAAVATGLVLYLTGREAPAAITVTPHGFLARVEW